MNARTFKKIIVSLALLSASVTASAADVGVSISVGQPGFYGRLDIGDYPYPQPLLIYNRPVVIYPVPGVVYEPLYLRVPPGHAKSWKRYCGRYDACGRPVYFVQDNWYRNQYIPAYRERRGEYDYDRDDRRGGGGKHNGKGKNGKGHR